MNIRFISNFHLAESQPDFEKPVNYEVVFELDFIAEGVRDPKFIEKIFLFSKEGTNKSAIETFHQEKQFINKYSVGALIQSESVLGVLRRELRKMSKGILVDSELIQEILVNDVLKREIVDNPSTKTTLNRLNRALKASVRPKVENEIANSGDEVEDDAVDPSDSTETVSVVAG